MSRRQGRHSQRLPQAEACSTSGWLTDASPLQGSADPSCQRNLGGLPAASQDNVLEAIKRLETNPFGPPPKIRKLKAMGIGQWRLEIWPYRVRYDIIRREVVLYRVRHRKEIYRE
ncbi:MAG: type II toxin-antitoxin system RelE/ParE family toxin [Candidatus Methylomirabilia bacterium]